jgi:hypothetical protein
MAKPQKPDPRSPREATRFSALCFFPNGREVSGWGLYMGMEFAGFVAFTGHQLDLPVGTVIVPFPKGEQFVVLDRDQALKMPGAIVIDSPMFSTRF